MRSFLVGDVIRVKVTNANGALVNKGEIGVITKVFPSNKINNEYIHCRILEPQIKQFPVFDRSFSINNIEIAVLTKLIKTLYDIK